MKTLLIILGIVWASVALGQDQPAKANSEYAREWVMRVNQIRNKGCKCGEKIMAPTDSLKWSDAVAEVAYLYAKKMSETRHYSHDEPDGTGFGDRLKRHGIGHMGAGENIAFGYGGIHEAFNGWLSSPGHCDNIMKPAFATFGVGSYNNYWVMVLGNFYKIHVLPTTVTEVTAIVTKNEVKSKPHYAQVNIKKSDSYKSRLNKPKRRGR